MGGQRIELTLVDVADVERARSAVALHVAGEVSVTDRTLTAQAEDPTGALVAVLGALRDEGIELHDAGIRRPTLDDVFLTLTGHGAEDEEVAA